MAENLAAWIRHLGNVSSHDCVLAVTPRLHNQVESILQDLRGAFRCVDLYVMESELSAGWPIAANHTFNLVATKMLGYAQKHAFFYFMEADVLPLSSEWLNRLERQHLNSRLPYTGVVNTTWMLNQHTGDLIDSGKHMVGTGIYPTNLWHRICLVPFLGKMKDPFDIVLAPYIYNPANPQIGVQCNNTELIHHGWQSVRYTKDSTGVLRYERNNFSKALKPLTPGFVNSDALIVHGCKDDSLLRILWPDHFVGEKSNTSDATLIKATQQPLSPSPVVNATVLAPAKSSRKSTKKHGIWKLSQRKNKSVPVVDNV